MLRRYINGDTGLALVLAVCGFYWMVGAIPLGFWVEFTPAAGFLPFWYGVLLCILSVINFVRSLRSPHREKGDGATKPLIVISIIAVALFILEMAGFVLTIFLTMMILFVIVERLPWIRALVVAIVVTVFLHLLFKVSLGVPLPAGPWGM